MLTGRMIQEIKRVTTYVPAVEVFFSRCRPGSREQSCGIITVSGSNLIGELLNVLQKRKQWESRDVGFEVGMINVTNGEDEIIHGFVQLTVIPGKSISSSNCQA